MPKHHRPKKAPSPTYNFIPPHCPKNFHPVIIANFDGGMNGGRGGAPRWSWAIVAFAGEMSPSVLRWKSSTQFDPAGWYDEPVDCHYEHEIGPYEPTHWLAHPPIPSKP